MLSAIYQSLKIVNSLSMLYLLTAVTNCCLFRFALEFLMVLELLNNLQPPTLPHRYATDSSRTKSASYLSIICVQNNVIECISKILNCTRINEEMVISLWEQHGGKIVARIIVK